MTATTNLSSYLKHCITRWYTNAKIGYYKDFSPEQLYNIWMEGEW